MGEGGGGDGWEYCWGYAVIEARRGSEVRWIDGEGRGGLVVGIMDEDRAGLLPSDLPVVLTSSTARMMELIV